MDPHCRVIKSRADFVPFVRSEGLRLSTCSVQPSVQRRFSIGELTTVSSYVAESPESAAPLAAEQGTFKKAFGFARRFDPSALTAGPVWLIFGFINAAFCSWNSAVSREISRRASSSAISSVVYSGGGRGALLGCKKIYVRYQKRFLISSFNVEIE